MSMTAQDAVLSCRVRLARNFRDLPFVHRMSDEQAHTLVDRVNDALNKNGEYRLLRMMDVGDNDRVRLVEQHLCSRELAMEPKGALLINKTKTMSIMINEEDHLRIQCILDGLNLYEADAQSAVVDREIAKRLTYAFDDKLGYLTACPTNLGTGMRASAMLHIPALVQSDQAERVLSAAAKFGLAVRGFYGEGSGAPGHIYQISNHHTLGVAEEDIISGLTETISVIAEQELRFRRAAFANNPDAMTDLVMRSFGICRYAHSLSFTEFMEHCSNIKLGISLDIIKDVPQATIDTLIAEGQSASLCTLSGKLLDEAEENKARAQRTRAALGGE